jgi:hypothetical protein
LRQSDIDWSIVHYDEVARKQDRWLAQVAADGFPEVWFEEAQSQLSSGKAKHTSLAFCDAIRDDRIGYNRAI